MTDSDQNHPFFSRLYTSVLRRGISRDPARCELVGGLRGYVVEVGCGDGANFPIYPGAVDDLLAVEPEPRLRRRAERAAKDSPTQIRVVGGDAEHLPVEDASVDAVVVSLVLCSVPSQQAALREFRRVLRPSGELRFYEHVRAVNRLGRVVQNGLDATIWPALFGGCHTARDTVAAITAAGFEIDTVRHTKGVRMSPPPPSVVGRARRPS